MAPPFTCRRQGGGVPSRIRLPRPAGLDRFARAQIFQNAGTRHGADVTNYQLQRPGALLRGRMVHEDRSDALVYFGGNAEHVTRWGDAFAEHVTDRAAYLVAYRGYGASSGQPTEEALVADALAVYDDVAARHAHVAVIGRSLGSGVAVQVAAARRPDRLVLITPFDSLVAVIRSLTPLPLPAVLRDRLPVQWLLADQFDSLHRAHLVTAPTLVLRAGQDAVVLPANTDRLLARLPADRRVVDFPDEGHVSLAERPEYWRAIGDFLQRDA